MSTDSASVALDVTDAHDRCLRNAASRASAHSQQLRTASNSSSPDSSEGRTAASDWNHMRSASISECVAPSWAPPQGRASAPPGLRHASSGPAARASSGKGNSHKWISRTMWDAPRDGRTSSRATKSVVPASPAFGSLASIEPPVRFCPTTEAAQVGAPGDGWARTSGVDVGVDVDVCFMGDTEGEDSLLEDEEASPRAASYGLAKMGAAEARGLFGPGSQSFVDVVAFSASASNAPQAGAQYTH